MRTIEFGCQQYKCSIAYAFWRRSESYDVLFQAKMDLLPYCSVKRQLVLKFKWMQLFGKTYFQLFNGH